MRNTRRSPSRPTLKGTGSTFLSFIGLSEALTLTAVASDGTAEIELAEGWHFVFGGDVCDKGGSVGGTVRVTRSLVRLKRRYPDRVVLLLGNRDLNKMRLTSELHPSQMSRLGQIPGPYWVPVAKQVTPELFHYWTVASRCGRRGGRAAAGVSR